MQAKAVITTLAPAVQRAALAQGTLDALGLPMIPVGEGSDGGAKTTQNRIMAYCWYLPPKEVTYPDGQDLMLKTFTEAEPKSLNLLIIASMKDAAEFLKSHEELFVAKIETVVIMGGILEFDKNDQTEYLVPDTAYNNNCDMDAAQFLYKRCQDLSVPLVIVTRHAAYGCPVPRCVPCYVVES